MRFSRSRWNERDAISGDGPLQELFHTGRKFWRHISSSDVNYTMRSTLFTFRFVIGIGLLAIAGCSRQPAPPKAPPAAAVTMVEAVSVGIFDRIEALGTLSATESVELTAGVTEIVESLSFQDGQRVEAGAVLATLSRTEEEALLVEAKANVAEAEKQFERSKQLAVGGAAAAAQLDESRRVYDTARARQVALESRLAELVIEAPFSGVVGLRNISVGALVRPGDLITTLDKDDVMNLDFSVPATFIESIQPGMRVEAKTRSFRAKTFSGEVRSIDSRIDPVTRSVVVRAEIPNPERILKPGLLMTVELTANPRQAVMIPEGTLLPARGENSVFIAEQADAGLKARKRSIAIGTRDAGRVEVVSGVAAGERVVLDGGFKLIDGADVRIVDRPPAPATREKL